LELDVIKAYDAFILGCKHDGIWDAIKASCILAGARTLSGALVPLKGSAPTNNGPFVAADYNRKTGLKGNGSTKYLDSNRSNAADPRNSNHNSVYRTFISNLHVMTTIVGEAGGNTLTDRSSDIGIRNRSAGIVGGGVPAIGLLGVNRSNSFAVTLRSNKVSTPINLNSEPASSTNLSIFSTATPNGFTSSRIAFYSIGESLDLAKLDTRVTDLITAIGAAIP
jgi:hypothetical protein